MIKNQTKVSIKSGACLPMGFTEGVVVGIMENGLQVSRPIYVVDVGRVINDVYPYQVVGVPEKFLRVIEDVRF